MSEQPPEDLGAAQVLLVVAVVLVVIVTGIVVLIHDRSPAPQRALERLSTSFCERELGSSVTARGCPGRLSQVQHFDANS